MENTPRNLLKEYVKSQNFASTTQIMDAMKDMFKDVLEQVTECEFEETLGFEKSQRISNGDDSCTSKNYRNGYSKKTVKTQLGELEVNIPRDRNGNYTPQIIPKYSRNADGMEKKILALYACGMSQAFYIFNNPYFIYGFALFVTPFLTVKPYFLQCLF